jgi:hypothetical protein
MAKVYDIISNDSKVPSLASNDYNLVKNNSLDSKTIKNASLKRRKHFSRVFKENRIPKVNKTDKLDKRFMF